MTLLQRAAHILCALCLGLAVSAPFAQAAAYADFRSDVQYRVDGKSVKTCGSAMSSGPCARMDLDLGSAGTFTLLIDTREHLLRVLSQRLKAYPSPATPATGAASSKAPPPQSCPRAWA